LSTNFLAEVRKIKTINFGDLVEQFEWQDLQHAFAGVIFTNAACIGHLLKEIERDPDNEMTQNNLKTICEIHDALMSLNSEVNRIYVKIE